MKQLKTTTMTLMKRSPLALFLLAASAFAAPSNMNSIAVQGYLKRSGSPVNATSTATDVCFTDGTHPGTVVGMTFTGATCVGGSAISVGTVSISNGAFGFTVTGLTPAQIAAYNSADAMNAKILFTIGGSPDVVSVSLAAAPMATYASLAGGLAPASADATFQGASGFTSTLGNITGNSPTTVQAGGTGALNVTAGTGGVLNITANTAALTVSSTTGAASFRASNGVTTIGSNANPANSTVITSGSGGKVTIGDSGTAFTRIGRCTIAATASSAAGATATCTGVPASTAVTVSCSPTAAVNTGVTARATGTLNQIALHSAAAGTSVAYNCVFFVP
ncbi:MAG: hypothetical protein ACK5P7_09225 [Bdellovibrio sp.]|jgi:hypothetical protein